jgi:hypothetical protein
MTHAPAGVAININVVVKNKRSEMTLTVIPTEELKQMLIEATIEGAYAAVSRLKAELKKDGWLSEEEAMSRTGLSARTLQRRALEGELEASHFDGKWQYFEDSLTEYKEKHRLRPKKLKPNYKP